MSKWNKYRLKDFAIDKNGKPYLYASLNTYGIRGIQPQKKAVFFPSKILDDEFVIVPQEKVQEIEKDIDWKVKFPAVVESIQTKEIDVMPKSVVEEIEGQPLETDKFSLLSQAVQIENDSVIYYQNLMEIFPEWREVLQDILNEELKHIGQLEALRNEQPQVGQKVDEGENEAEAQMNGVAVEGADKMKGQMNYKGVGAKESYYVDNKIMSAFEDFEDEHLGKSTEVSPQKDLKMAKVPEGVGVANEYWEDNGYKQHVWIMLKDNQSKEEVSNILGKPDGEGYYSDDKGHSWVMDYYFDTLEGAQNFVEKIPDEYDYDYEETDEDANESITKDERESIDPEAKEACACESCSEECSRLLWEISEAENDSDLDNCEYLIEDAHTNGDITEEEFNYLYGELNSRR